MLFTLPVVHVQGQNVQYITQHLALANKLSEQFGIPAPVILAVAMVESASGTGKAAKNLNNHFGIVGKNHQKPKKGAHTSRYKEYKSVAESYSDFCKLISGKSFYSCLKDSADCVAWVKAISTTGYSTQPSIWKKRVLSTIASNKL